MLKEDKYPSDFHDAYELLNHFIAANNIPEVKGGLERLKVKKEAKEL